MTFRGFLHHLNRRDTRLFPKFTKTAKFLIFLFVFISASFAINSFAQVDLFKQKQDALKAGTNLEAWNDEAIGNNAFSMFRGMVGELPPEVLSGDFLKTGNHTAWIPQGLFGTANNMIATLNTPPASGIEYIASTWNSFLGKPAYAQGVGFQGLAVLLPLWRGFRNITYVLFSLVFVVIGLMIILRVKISPQAVVTIQNAIPQLVTALILVTFSYAIAGLFIDFSYLLQGIVVALFFQMNDKKFDQSLFQPRLTSDFVGLGWLGDSIKWIYDNVARLWGKGPDTFGALANPDFGTFLQLAYRAAPGWWTSLLLGGLLGSVVLGTFLSGIGAGFLGGLGADVTNLVGGTVGGLVGGVLGGVLFPLIICIATSFWLIKLYFGMLKAYVNIILKIIIGPLEIAIGAFPASKMGFSSWATDLIASISIFPIVSLFLILINLIVDAFYNSGISNVWAPGPIFFTNSANSSILAGCIGLVGIALISKLPEMIPQLIFQLKNPWGTAVGESLSGIVNNPIKALNTAAGISKGSQEVWNAAHGVRERLQNQFSKPTSLTQSQRGQNQGVYTGGVNPNNQWAVPPLTAQTPPPANLGTGRVAPRPQPAPRYQPAQHIVHNPNRQRMRRP